MTYPLAIDFQNVDASEAVAARIRERAAKLEHFSERITSCHVIVEAPHRHHRKGMEYHIRILLRLPGEEIVVSRDPGDDRAHSDIFVAVRDAFDAAERRLKDHAGRLRSV